MKVKDAYRKEMEDKFYIYMDERQKENDLLQSSKTALYEALVDKIINERKCEIEKIVNDKVFRIIIFSVIVGCFSFLTVGFWVYVCFAIIFILFVKLTYPRNVIKEIRQCAIKALNVGVTKDRFGHNVYPKEHKKILDMGADVIWLRIDSSLAKDLYSIKWSIDHNCDLCIADRESELFLKERAEKIYEQRAKETD